MKPWKLDFWPTEKRPGAGGARRLTTRCRNPTVVRQSCRNYRSASSSGEKSLGVAAQMSPDSMKP
jgi:hypothetical protein